jgi:sensor histidine kinase regulating citrate/malate metabolism
VYDKPRGEKMLELRVDDSGAGIAEEIRDRMFEPFVSLKRTVGEVTVVSRPEGGSSSIMVHPVRDPRHRDRSQDDDE